MPIGAVKNGHIIGYKYFGFGGLAQDTKGLKAFAGTMPGNETAFNLWLKPQTSESFKVNVWLDGPWDNAAWKGTKIGEIEVPANSKLEVTQFTIDVAQFVDHLDKKNAIFLVAEGTPETELFELVGLGFSAEGKTIERPMVPQVSILVDGQEISLPQTPVRSTNTNGIVGYDLYRAKVDGAAGKVTASSDHPDVQVAVVQANQSTGTAEVAFDYNGLVKTYQLVFETE